MIGNPRLHRLLIIQGCVEFPPAFDRARACVVQLGESGRSHPMARGVSRGDESGGFRRFFMCEKRDPVEPRGAERQIDSFLISCRRRDGRIKTTLQRTPYRSNRRGTGGFHVLDHSSPLIARVKRTVSP